MKMVRTLVTGTGLAALAALSMPALAQTAPAAPAQAAPPTTNSPASQTPAPGAAAVTAGATVYDTQGGTVGTVETVDGGYAVVATSAHKARLPLTSFGAGANGPVIAMTAAQLDAAAAAAAPPPQAAAPQPAQLAKGQAVTDTQGGAVGTIEEVGTDFAVVSTGKNKARLPLNAFAAGPNGPMIGMTQAQLDAAASAASGG